MLNLKIKEIIDSSREQGWVLEPDAKAIMKTVGLDVPKGIVTGSVSSAQKFLKDVEGGVVIKAVSGQILHKTEFNAVVVGVESASRLEAEMQRLLSLPGCEKVLVEEMVQGIEVIIGAKNDYQFGPVVVFGLGGTGVEIYNDTSIRLAPLKSGDVLSMVDCLRANRILTGYRGGEGISLDRLTQTMVEFSKLMIELENDVASIDLNPVMCTTEKCVVADARIVLNTYKQEV